MRKPLPMICVGRWRLPRCQAIRTRCCGSAPLISTSGSGAATTSTSRPSSSTSASPPRKATAFSRSSKNSSPRVPVIAIRRRCRSSKSSTTVSAGASVQRYCPRTSVARIMLGHLNHGTGRWLHPSRRGQEAAPQDEVLDPHGEERGKTARLEPRGRDGQYALHSPGSCLYRVHLGVADDLDHGRRGLERRGIFAPYLHVRRAAVGVEVVAAVPALHHDIGVGIVDAGMAFVGNTALFPQRLGDAFLVPGAECIALVRLYLRGGDDVGHSSLPCCSCFAVGRF